MLTITLVIPTDGKTSQRHIYSEISGYDPKLFNTYIDVLITNEGKIPINIWNENCSWGYENLSFRVLVDNAAFDINKPPIPWRENSPVFWLIGAGEHFVFHVNIFSNSWSGLPEASHSIKEVSIKGIYDVEETKESKEMKVWTGKIESQPLTALIHF